MRQLSAFQRALLCLALILPSVAACQSPQGVRQNTAAEQALDESIDQSLGSGDENPFGQDVESTGIFDMRVKKALAIIMKRSIQPCMDEALSATGQPDIQGVERCSMRNVATAFDASGTAARHCIGDDIEESMNCVLFGVMLQRLRESDGKSMAAADWQNAQKKFMGESIGMFIDEGLACSDGLDLDNETSKRCLAQKVTERFTGDREIGYPCVEFMREKFGQCLAEASLTSIIEEASATGT